MSKLVDCSQNISGYPPETVFPVGVDAANLPELDGFNVTVGDNTFSEGALVHVGFAVASRDIGIDGTVTSSIEPRLIVVEGESLLGQFALRCELSRDVNEGTNMSYGIFLDPSFVAFPIIGGVRRFLRSNMPILTAQHKDKIMGVLRG
jgi:hypothetical protein